MQAIEGYQHAGFLKRFDVFYHRFDGLGVWHRSRRRVLITLGDHQHHESHRVSPVLAVSLRNRPKDAGEPLTSTNGALCAGGARPVDFAPLYSIDSERFSWVRATAGADAARFIRALSASPARRIRPRRKSAPPPRSNSPAWGVACAT